MGEWVVVSAWAQFVGTECPYLLTLFHAEGIIHTVTNNYMNTQCNLHDQSSV